VLEKSRRVLGEEHPDVLFSMIRMGSLLLAEGKPDEAEPYFREALEKSHRVLGDENPTTLSSLSEMGLVLQAKGKLAEAEPYLHEALETNRRLFGEQDRSTLVLIRDMGSLLVDQGKAGEALALLAPAETAMRKEFTGARSTAPNGETNYLARYLTSLGMAHAALGQYSDAEANLIEASGILAASSYPNDLRDCTHALV
jgi:tetratricopeptide (TPR) repeat protein